MARPLWWGAEREQQKPTTEKGVGRVCDLDLGHVLLRWVVEGGIKMMARSTGSIMTS
jgi:hypothetical protein